MSENNSSDGESAFSLRRSAVGAVLMAVGIVGIGGVIQGVSSGNPLLAALSIVLVCIVAYLLVATFAEAVRRA